MAVPIRLASFVVALVAVFGLAFGVGRITGGPTDGGTGPHEMTDGDMVDGDMAGAGATGGHADGPDHGGDR